MQIGIITCEILRREIKDVIEKTGYNKLFFSPSRDERPGDEHIAQEDEYQVY